MTTPQAARLTQAHRLIQIRIGAQTVLQLAAAFKILDPADLDGTVDQWLRVTVPVIQNQRRLSATTAARYLAQHRAVEIGGKFTPRLAEAGNATAIATSLVVTGPVSIKAAMRAGTNLSRAATIAAGASAAAGMRHALDGGRETIVQTAAADKRASGWVRVASGNACTFCEGLAAEPAGANSDFEAHDSCGCTAEIAYD